MILVLAPAVGAAARETASPSDCRAAAARSPIAEAKAAADRDAYDLRAKFTLADAWSDAGCFNDALQVLQDAQTRHPDNKELKTRVRVARSLVGEEHFFDDLDRANIDAKLKRDYFRCTTLADIEACGEAVRLKPDDPDLWAAQGDALLHAKRPADALSAYRRAAGLAPNQADLATKMHAAEAQLPPSQNPAVAAVTAAAIAERPSAPRATPDAGTARMATGAATAPPAAARKPAVPLHVARSDQRGDGDGDGDKAVRRYSNAAPDSQSH